MFLLGAGASKDAGFPLTEDFFDYLDRSFQEAIAVAGTPDERAMIEAEQRLYAFTRKHIRQADSPFADPENFEYVIATVNQLRYRFRSKLFPFVEGWAPSLTEFSGFPLLQPGGLPQVLQPGGLARVKEWPRPFLDSTRAYAGKLSLSEGLTYDRLYNRVLWSVRNWLRLDAQHRDLTYLAELARLARPNNVFTLNYDLSVEAACINAGIPFTTGFTPQKVRSPFPPGHLSQGQWDPKQFDEADHHVRLYKLHGSISWFHAGAVPELELAEYPPEEWPRLYESGAQSKQKSAAWHDWDPPTMLFAGGTKLPGFEPYVTLYQRFLSLIRAAEVLVVIGCRWNFEPLLRDVIGREATKGSSPLALIHVTIGGDDQFPNVLTCGAKEAMSSGKLEKAIAHVQRDQRDRAFHRDQVEHLNRMMPGST